MYRPQVQVPESGPPCRSRSSLGAMQCAALAMLALAACGDNHPDPTQPQSGSRLKLAWYEYDGGARELERSWYFDTTLDDRCTPTTWSDGLRYCTPAFDEAVYVTDTCTRALGRTVVSPASAPPATYFATMFTPTGSPQSAPSRLFRRGAPVTMAPTAIWQKSTDGCRQMELGPGFDYFELGEEVPMTDLVGVRRGAPEGAGEIAVIDDIGDDGLVVPVALYDTVSEAECTTSDIPNAHSVPCAPTTTVTAIEYSTDTSCTTHVVALPADSTPPLVTFYDEQTSCLTYYGLGRSLAIQESQSLFQRGETECVRAPWPVEPTEFFERGERAYPPELARLRESGPRRIRAIARVNGALRVMDRLMYDAKLDTECAHDEEMQCMPEAAGSVVPATRRAYFADEQCQTPISLAFVPRRVCDPPLRFATDGAEYYELREPYTNPIFVPASTGGTCIYAPPVPEVAYQVGEPMPRSAFALANLVIDP